MCADTVRTVLLGVSGSIAAYKAVEVASRLTQAGHRVVTLLTAHAQEFVRPLSFEAVTNQSCLTGEFAPHGGHRPLHTELARSAALYLLAPATANLIGKLAAGIADDVVTSTALAVDCPVLVAPAMNARMWGHPFVQRNLQTLRAAGHHVVEPAEGWLACGDLGPGRLAEPAAIVEAALRELGR
ncbi:MAG: phosphopantothenoylcysteine decarboxylase [Planctomycetes bacterium]|nr:phosphopantothenoylcysteine decarboxylase [Planctomycetota bacterium]